ncbi:lysophospholipid acyltransferase family protein [Synergistaceae bacterium OttesenSCG-928-I11]|nr:lysophospholipid acyltransferase family protein [Synergistaceae bacterium OttesenSCG-928-I11]
MKKQPAIWTALQVFEKICNALPHERAVRMGAALGRTVERCSKARVGRARARAEKILGVTESEARGIVSRAYEHFGRALVEFLRLPQTAHRLDELVTLRGEEHISAALARGKGVIFLSAHIGCWEYGAALLAQHGFPMNAIGAEQRDPRMTDAIARLRQSAGVKTVGKGLDLRAAVECLKGKGILAILLDQDAREAGVVSPFLGQPASTPIGPIKLARKFGSPVVPVHIVRNPDGFTMTMTIEPPLEGTDGRPFGDDVQDAADRCNAAISRWIRANPDQWMWMYPRWATTLGDR